jgi:uncharacterized Zn-binding protein involved in type VI secretion
VSRSLRRGAVAALIIATAPILSACAAGDTAASLKVKPDSAATSITNGASALKLNGITVITRPDGVAPASVNVNIANDGSAADTLTGVTVNGVPAVLSGDMTIQPLDSLRLGTPGQPSAVVQTLDASPGQNTTVAFTFATAGSVQVLALINPGVGQYAAYAPTPSPTPAPVLTATATPTPTGTPTGTATSTATVGKVASTKKP